MTRGLLLTCVLSVSACDQVADRTSDASDGATEVGSSDSGFDSAIDVVDAKSGDAMPDVVDAGFDVNVTILATNQTSPGNLVVDQNTAYWTSAPYPQDLISKCDVNGCNGTPTILADDGEAQAFGLTVHGSSFFWTDNESLIQTCPTSGCGDAGATLIFQEQMYADPSAIVVDANNVYWTSVAVGTVSYCPLAGCNGSPTTLASNQLSPEDLVIDGTNAYWANFANNGEIVQCAIGGCGNNPTVLAAQQSVAGLLLLNGNLYWTSGGAVMACAVSACTPTPVALGQFATALATDGASLYWANGNSGRIVKCAATGCGSPTVVVPNVGAVWAIAVDTTSVYWTDATNSLVAKAPK
jgi:hypothetical protein